LPAEKKSNFLGNLPGKSDFFKFCLKKSTYSGNLPGKIDFFYLDPRPPRFQTRVAPLSSDNIILINMKQLYLKQIK